MEIGTPTRLVEILAKDYLSVYTSRAPLPKYYVFVETSVKQSSTSTLIASALNSRNVEFGPTFLSHLVPK
jgi:hypothetical protein